MDMEEPVISFILSTHLFWVIEILVKKEVVWRTEEKQESKTGQLRLQKEKESGRGISEFLTILE